MTILANSYVEGILFLAVGICVGYYLYKWKYRHAATVLELDRKSILDAAQREAEAVIREARLTANEELLKQKADAENALSVKRQEIQQIEQRLADRDSLINRQLEGLVQQERLLLDQQKSLKEKEQSLASTQQELKEIVRQRREQLIQCSHLSEVAARDMLLKEVEQETLRDAGDLARHIMEQAKSKAEDEAKRILCLAIQRYAGDHAFETTTTAISLPNEEIKGRIIGREGRNIRAFESITGVTVLIDDTPNAVVLSSFDPVRRQVAYEAMQRLILDGRIHPTRIEEVVAKVIEEVDESILRAGEDAIFKVGLPPMSLEIVKILGRLRFRYSFSQNILDHSIEVAHLAGVMAAELGFDISLAKRAGLLHDIGKAVNHEVEGSHAAIGADLLKRHDECEMVVNAVASHHGDVPYTTSISFLISAADAISASRPGARSETMTTYLRRLENLEKIGYTFPGVEKCFAVQAGRELRVLVQPETVNDDQAYALARSLVRKIEDELQYPGQIRITVIRETRCVEFAK